MEASTSSNSTTTTTDLFICFTSRLSKLSSSTSTSTSTSKSLLSPARSSQISLSTSLSRRLRSAGQASPMFPSAKKRSGAAAFDNPEPSSPKVTCIGQVRVKSKAKKNNHNRCRRSLSLPPPPPSPGEASFRRPDHDKAGRWVTICEALKLNCFLPSCRSSDEKKGCGAVLGRWLVSDGKGGRREIELVVAAPAATEKKEEEEAVVERSGSLKRSVFEGMEFREVEEGGGGGVEKARVSLCVPPKNALLLMRCRSDPVKMAALATRFWPGSDQQEQEDDEEEEEEAEIDNVEEDQRQRVVLVEEEESEKTNGNERPERNHHNAAVVVEEQEAEADEIDKAEEQLEHEEDAMQADEPAMIQPRQDSYSDEEEEEEDNMFRLLYEDHDPLITQPPPPPLPLPLPEEEEMERDCKTTTAPDDTDTQTQTDSAVPLPVPAGGLPDCLLLMMCEPKLSMEVSKETWVCTTDFVRWLPDRRRPAPKKPPPAAARALPPKPPSAVLLQPPRSSCSSVAAADRALAAKPYEPFLTRCKSEPRAGAAAAPEPCFWKNRKLEPQPVWGSEPIGI